MRYRGGGRVALAAIGFAAIGLAAIGAASADPARSAPPAGRSLVDVVVDARTIPVVVLVPPEPAPARGFPLVVSLHGQSVDGGRECDHNWRALRGVVVACPTEPSAPWRGAWGEKLVLTVVRALLQRWTIDPDRVFLSGASTGGIGAWRYGLRRPDRFAGVIPRAGMPPLWNDAVLQNLLGTGLYVVHGIRDTTIRPDADRRAVERLHELGGDVTWRELDGAHSAFPGESGAIATWIERRRRNPAPPRFRYALSPNLGELPDRVHWLELGGRSGLPLALEARIDRAAGTVDVDFHEGWVERLSILLDDRLVDARRPIVVRVGGVQRFQGSPDRSPELQRRLVESTGDPSVGFDRQVSLDLGIPVSVQQQRSRTSARPVAGRRRGRRAALRRRGRH